ncbi:MAG: hypothetical protein KC583_24705 [Myxococcales bacterium]|nr:hypothetical protein [Myxococcales bacterium]
MGNANGTTESQQNTGATKMNLSDIVEALEEFNTCSIGGGTTEAKELEQIIVNAFRILDIDVEECRRIVSDCFDL